MSESDTINRLIATARLTRATLEPALGAMGEDAKWTTEELVYLAVAAFYTVQGVERRLDAYESRGANEWMTMQEAMQTARCSRSTINRAIKSGELKSDKANGRRVIQRTSLDHFARFRDLMSS